MGRTNLHQISSCSSRCYTNYKPKKITVTIVTGYNGSNPKLIRFYRNVCLPVVNISNVDNNYHDALLSDVQLPRQCAFVKMFTAACSLFRLFWVICAKIFKCIYIVSVAKQCISLLMCLWSLLFLGQWSVRGSLVHFIM